MISQNPSTKIQAQNKKTMIEWYTNDMQVLEQWCTQKKSPNAQIYSRKIYED